MTPREEGFLLLTCRFGDPERRVLTMPQLRLLGQRAATMEPPGENRDLTEGDIRKLGFGEEFSRHIVALLEQTELMEAYLRRGRKLDCQPISRVSPVYPTELRQKLGLESPGCLWAKGNLALLNTPMAALVGSRELREENAAFAAEVGRQAAFQGFTLVSGNARGADRIAQNACLESGGRIISVVADALSEKQEQENLLWLSEDGFDEGFSAQRALSRNRVIHALGVVTFVAQCNRGTGGTWDGTVKNLVHGWSPVWGFRDGSEAMAELEQMGAGLMDIEKLWDFCELVQQEPNFLLDL